VRKWALVLAAVALLLLLVAILYPVYTSPVQEEGYSAYGDNWNDLSTLRNNLDRDTRTIITTPTMLTDLENKKNTVLFIVGLQKEYSELEVEAVVDFVEDGGKLVLANNNELGNPIAERFGVKFFEENVLDPAFMSLGERNISIFQQNATLKNVNYTIRFNSPVGLEVEDGEVICQSSSNSSLDLNDNGLRDLSDKRGPIPLIAISNKGGSDGMAVFISSPSVFVNQEISQADNLNFTRDLVDYLLEWNQEGSTDVVVSGEDLGEPLIIFEESRHVPSRDRQVIYNAITILTYLSKHPILVAVVLINLACIGLFWWLANPRPKPFKHIDRLGDTNPRDTEVDGEYLRDVMLLKMVTSPPIEKDHTILSADDLKEHLKKLKRKKLMKIVGDKELADLVMEKKKVKVTKALRTKVIRWEYNGRSGK
jgi:hypothetical protein